MAGDIEAFLKMAAERRRKAMEAEGKAAPSPPAPSQPTAYQPSQPASPPRPTYQPPQQPPQQTYQRQAPSARPAPPPPQNRPYSPAPVRQPAREVPVEVELVEVEPLASDDPYYEDDYASEGSRFGRPHLVSSEVSSADIAEHADHLHDNWAEDSTLDGPKTPPRDLAKELREMLQDPSSIAKAVVLNEILKRPDFD